MPHKVPPFNFTENVPADDDIVSQFPVNERDMRHTLVSWLTREHSPLTGRHKIPAGTTTARDALTDWETGSLWINTTIVPNRLQMNTGTPSVPVWEDLGNVVTSTANIFTALQTFASDVLLTSTDPGALAAPKFDLFRDSVSPAASDELAEILARGRNSNNDPLTYSRLLSVLKTPTAGAEDGEFWFQTRVGGALATRAILGGGLYSPGVTGGDKGTGSINFANIFKANVPVRVAGDVNVQTFNGNGTWTRPAAATDDDWAIVLIWGGGGGGGRVNTFNAAGGGGAAGFYGWAPLSALGSSVAVTVGTGGAGASSGFSGADGTDSTFGSFFAARAGGGGGAGDGTAIGGGGGGTLTAGASGEGAGGGGGFGEVSNGGASANPGGAGGYDGGGGGGSAVNASTGGRGYLGGGGGGGNASGATGGTGGASVWGGGGGTASRNSGAGAGGTSKFGGRGGDGRSTPGENGATPGGGGGAGAGGGGNGGNGRCIVYTFMSKGD